jgi:glutathione synthase/RimK-type ligase-like ATP-grasp enzyme
MNNVFMYPYKMGSVSAASLANAMNIRRIQHENSRFRGRVSRKIVNWGASVLPESTASCGLILNHPNKVAVAANKLRFFNKIKETTTGAPRVPDWTLDAGEAASWLENEEARYVFARTVLNGHSGQGIVEYSDPTVLREAPSGVLYVKYVPKKEEYRVHVSKRDGIFLVQRKVRRRDTEVEHFRIRNADRGFVYMREGVELPNEAAGQQAIAALTTLELDFGAVDLIYNQRQEQAYVLEVNTAPGLEGTSVLDYSNMLTRLLENE